MPLAAALAVLATAPAALARPVRSDAVRAVSREGALELRSTTAGDAGHDLERLVKRGNRRLEAGTSKWNGRRWSGTKWSGRRWSGMKLSGMKWNGTAWDTAG